ncbi:MAG: DUF502 domain-containing protein [Chitinophagaceae bacterium]|nr:DUF502 domain-containing protein [Chitinophagaceae bacterium]MCW5904963.1 DUF502 domain-containing protein [Chitinophagaceae bacterium]
MNKNQLRAAYKNQLKKLLQYFIQGLIVLAPIGITVWAILSLFNVIDDFLPNILHRFFPEWIGIDAEGNIDKTTGLGFVLIIAFVLLVGRLSSVFMVGRLVEVLDKVLENTPGIKIIYGSVKDFLEAFAGNKKKFDKPVLVSVDAADVWRIGFITRLDAKDLELKEHVVVYVPHSYAISGITYIVPKNKIKPLTNISAADAMKFTLTGGVVELDE